MKKTLPRKAGKRKTKEELVREIRVLASKREFWIGAMAVCLFGLVAGVFTLTSLAAPKKVATLPHTPVGKHTPRVATKKLASTSSPAKEKPTVTPTPIPPQAAATINTPVQEVPSPTPSHDHHKKDRKDSDEDREKDD